MLEFYNAHKKIIKSAVKLWGPIASLIILVYIYRLFGFLGLIVGLLILGCCSLALFSYLDFSESMKDPSFNVIFRNLNKINEIFNKNIDYRQYTYLSNNNLIHNPFFDFNEHEVASRDCFYGVINKMKFSFYQMEDGKNFGFVMSAQCIDTGMKKKESKIYLISKAKSLNPKKIKNNHLYKIGETIKFNIYSTDRKAKITNILDDRIDLLVPEGSKRLRFVILENNEITYYIDKLRPFSIQGRETIKKEDEDILLQAEMNSIRKTLESLTVILYTSRYYSD